MVNRAAVELQNEQIEVIERGGTVIVEVPLHDVDMSGCPVAIDLVHAVVTHEHLLLLTIRKRRAPSASAEAAPQ